MKLKKQKTTIIVLAALFVILLILYFAVIVPLTAEIEDDSPAVELIEGEVYFRRICRAMDSLDEIPEVCTIFVPSGEISKAVGQKRRNKIRIEYRYNVKKVKFIENSSLKRYNILL